MLKLTPAMQLAVVHSLARGAWPSHVVAEIRERFGVEPTLAQVAAYNPTKPAGRHLSPKLRTVFYVALLAHGAEAAADRDETRCRKLRELLLELEKVPARGKASSVAITRILAEAVKSSGAFG